MRDLGLLLAEIVAENESPLVAVELLQAPVKTFEQPFPLGGRGVRAQWRWNHDISQRRVPMFPARVLQEHEAGDDVTVSSRRVCDRALFFEPARNPVQCFVGKVVRRTRALAIEVQHQPSTHFEVALAAGFDAFVQPGQEVME